MPQPEITIRRATPTDIPALHRLLTQYYREGDVRLTEDEFSLAAYVNQPHLGFYVAELAGQLIACVLCRPLTSPQDAAECKRLYVLPEFRGRHVAHMLMDAIEAAAQAAGLHWMYLDSKDDFQTAIAMYRGLGYLECDRYNDNPQATIFLRKPLKP